MNFLSSVTSARHDHPGQKVLKYFSRFQQQNTLLEETLDLSQKENTLQRELTARLPASLHGYYYGSPLQAFRYYLTDRLMGIGLFPKSGEVIDKVSSMVILWPVKSQRMRLCQCLGLVITASVSGLSAGMLELPLPEGSESVLVSIADDRPNHQQTIWTLPVGKMVAASKYNDFRDQ